MPGAKFTETYEKVSKMGEKLKAAGKSGPSNDEQLHVRFRHFPRSELYLLGILDAHLLTYLTL
jgi:hypothetical protein